MQLISVSKTKNGCKTSSRPTAEKLERIRNESGYEYFNKETPTAEENKKKEEKPNGKQKDESASWYYWPALITLAATSFFNISNIKRDTADIKYDARDIQRTVEKNENTLKNLSEDMDYMKDILEDIQQNYNEWLENQDLEFQINMLDKNDPQAQELKERLNELMQDYNDYMERQN